MRNSLSPLRFLTMAIGCVFLFVACGGSAKNPISTGGGGSRGGGGTNSNATDGGSSSAGMGGGGASASGNGGAPGIASGGAPAAGRGGSANGGGGGFVGPNSGGAVGSGAGGSLGTAGGSAGGGGHVSSPGGAGGAGGNTAAPTTQQCEQLTMSLCTSAATCVANSLAGNCVTQLELEFGCGQSGPIDFVSCLRDTQNAAGTCGGLFPDGNLRLPSACFPPIQATALSDAQTKCYELVDLLCTRSITCSGATVTSIDVQNCEDDVTTNWNATTNLFDGIPCLLASSVGPGYAQCAAAIPTAACVSAGAGGAGGSGAPVATVPTCANAIVFSR